MLAPTCFVVSHQQPQVGEVALYLRIVGKCERGFFQQLPCGRQISLRRVLQRDGEVGLDVRIVDAPVAFAQDAGRGIVLRVEQQAVPLVVAIYRFLRMGIGEAPEHPGCTGEIAERVETTGGTERRGFVVRFQAERRLIDVKRIAVATVTESASGLAQEAPDDADWLCRAGVHADRPKLWSMVIDSENPWSAGERTTLAVIVTDRRAAATLLAPRC